MTEHAGQLSLFELAAEEPPSQPPGGADAPITDGMATPPAASQTAVADSSAADSTAADSTADGDRPDALDVADLERRLESRLGRPIASVTLTRNRSRIVSARPSPQGIEVRIHRCFADAEDPVIEAVASFLTLRGDPRRRQALAVIRRHFREHGQDDTKPPRTPRPKGRVYDLEPLRDRINREYFDGALDVGITWGRAPTGLPTKRRGGVHIRLGSYHDADRLVRIHPVLDRADVPEYVVAAVVHHEMVHAAVPPEPSGPTGRRRVHTRRFRELERRFVHYAEAERWLDEHLGRLDGWRRNHRWF